MKKLLYILLISLTGFLSSCEDESSYDDSKVTYYVNFDMKGEQTTLVTVGSSYTDEGVVATEGETDITSSVVKTGTVDPTKVGVYYISYSATNVDGYSSSVTRTVIVYDPTITTDISGTYKVASGSYRYWLSSGAKVSFSGYDVALTYVAPGIFEASDYFGGYYDKRAGYGSTYAMKGFLKLNSDNTLEALSGTVAGWGDSFKSFDNAKYDPASGSVYWEVAYAGAMVFYITLTK